MGQPQRVVELYAVTPDRGAPVESFAVGLPAKSLGACLVDRAFPASAWCGAQVRELLTVEPAFGMNLLRHGPAYIHVLALAHLAPDRLPQETRARARFLMTASYRCIVEETAGLPRAVITVLGKLGTRVHRRHTYEALLRTAGDGQAWKMLRHYRRIEPVHLRLVSALPSAYLRAPVVRKVRNDQHFEAIVAAVHKAEAVLGVANRPRIAASFCAVKDFKGLQPWLSDMLAAVPFPEPPWAGNAELRPLRNGRDLKAAALHFKNCAASFTDEARAGNMHFYVSGHGRTRVMIAIERNPYFGWIVHDLKGPSNREIPKRRMAETCAVFEAAGVLVTRLSANALQSWDY